MALRFRQLEKAVEKLRGAMLPASANDELIEIVMALHQSIDKLDGKEALKVFTTLVPRVSTFATKSADLQFGLRSLQKVYDSEVKGVFKFADEVDWLLNSEAQLVVELRKLLFAIDLKELKHLLHLGSGRMLSIHGVVRNSYLSTLDKPFKAALQLSGVRLHALVKKYQDVIQRLQQSDQIALPHFWKLKGEICEMLCQQVKLDVLAEIRLTYPSAQLIENVMAATARTREGGTTVARVPRQIWDGIIAVPTPNGLKILRVFEVKSGLKGFDEALEQVQQTHLNRFASTGDELHMTLADGTRRIYRLGAKGGNNGVDLSDCLNTMLHPSGDSSMMPNQHVLDEVIPFVTRLIELQKRELSHFDVEALTIDVLLAPHKYL